jgi:hypothetical protein
MRAALFVILCLGACASSKSSGTAIDAESGDDDSGTGDSGGGGDIDGAPGAIDAAVIDGQGLGGIDASTPADASTCPTSPCDLVQQCGCGPTQACDIDGSDLIGTACRGVTVAGDENDTCTAASQCGAGYVCVGDAAGESCKAYCASTTDCASPRGQCVIQLTNQTGAPIDGAVVCSSNCDPANASNPLCPSGWSCDIFTATFQSVDHDIADCRVVGTMTQGQACSATSACQAGLTCVNNGTSDVCGKICRRPAGTECTGGTTCYGFQTPFVVGTQEYGVCL